MSKAKFGGDQKVGQSILSRPEKALVAWGTPRVPKCIETYHLTMLTVLWSGLNVLFGYLAFTNINWLWMVSLMILLQYITDLYDGAIGRARNTGLIKWGFYMDHFLDYVFLSSLVVAGYLLAPAVAGVWYIFLLVLVGCFMVSSFLSFAATNKFEIYFFGVGPTELRILFIAINTCIIYTGTAHLVYSVPIVCVLCALGLVYIVYQTHTTLWRLDMEIKADRENE
jgi:phosphatidylglycerophosphate synthase